MLIRKAETSEISTLLAFEAGIIHAERPYDSSLKEGEIHYYDLIELINSQNAEVLVAEIDGKLVGSGYAKILEAKTFQKYSLYAYLGFMYVLPEYRGKGINQAIIDQLIEWSISKNITEIRLEVYDNNIPAKKAYQKAGFTANLLEMRLDLSSK